MQNQRNTASVILYNVVFPIWILIWLPSPLWLVLIPINYLIDTLVLAYSFAPKGAVRRTDRKERQKLSLKHSWKTCLIGFLADFVGASFLYLMMILLDKPDIPLLQKTVYGITINPFYSVLAFLIVTAAVVIAGLIIYSLNLVMLKRTGLQKEAAKRSAWLLALFTAPYLFYFPIDLIYRTF